MFDFIRCVYWDQSPAFVTNLVPWSMDIWSRAHLVFLKRKQEPATVILKPVFMKKVEAVVNRSRADQQLPTNAE